MNKIAKKREQKNYLENKGKRPQTNRNLKEYQVTKRVELLTFLLETLKGVSRNNVKSILSHHCVSIHGAPVTQFNYVLYPGDTVIISKTPFKTQKEGKFSLEILYEDDEFIAVNKPHGLLSVSSDKEKTRTAYKLVLDYLIKKDKHNHLFVVHRIDRETSGVLMFCKNEKIRDIMQEKWNEIVAKRGYFAIVDGQVKDKEGTVKSWLKMNKENLMYVAKDRKNAQFCVTHYKVLKQSMTHTLLDVNIDSGRKNQIRVQLGSIGHHVVGDDKYGDPTDPINRLGLHAYSLIFTHPINGKTYKFETKMPKGFLSIF